MMSKHYDKKEEWYYKKLAAYFDKHYRKYDPDILWWIDPAPNQWSFHILDLNVTVTLTCDDNGAIIAELE